MLSIIDHDIEYLQKEFVRSLFDSINQLAYKDRIIIWLSWWSSVNNFYDIFRSKFGDIEYNIRKKIYFCFLDERLVLFDNADSNFKLLKSVLFDDLIDRWLMTLENILLPDLAAYNIWEDYFNKIKEIDIWLFGVGPDNHICSLFPWHAILDNMDLTYLEIYDAPKPPSERITISKNIINKIKFWFIFFIWSSKEKALRTFLDSNTNYSDCPSKFLENCESLVLISDIILD